ncbi:ATP-binding cassette sub-family D member 2 [Smittium mucronatum]|uniref:ATP-binding cassette sub-family D member 2 n=1 Tax=Smittium mucronatum TaxID=133383 RepID=A0A1R0GVR1_9FUNG|nr:ATP-binding cassette sub-family D member 2 [Smittium mucronatum]
MINTKRIHLPPAISALAGSSKSFANRLYRDQIRILNFIVRKYLKHKSLYRSGILSLTVLYVLRQFQKVFYPSYFSKNKAIPPIQNPTPNDNIALNSPKNEINPEFFSDLKKIVKIIIPGFWSKEFGTLILHTAFLVLRTLLSVYTASLDGEIVYNMVGLNIRGFIFGLCKWMLVSIPATITNSSLEYFQKLLSLQFRKRLTDNINDIYFKGRNFYAISNLDSRIKNIDQIIVVDVQKFCSSLTLLYSNLVKPSLDFVIYNSLLYRRIGPETLFAASAIIQLSTSLLRALTPPFGALVAQEQKLEGDLYFAHARTLANSEEIALWKGHLYEKQFVLNTYNRLIRHVDRVFKLHIFYGMVEDFVIKYLWGSIGFLTCAAPIFAHKWAVAHNFPEDTLIEDAVSNGLGGGIDISGDIVSSRARDFVTNRRLLLSASDSVGRIIYMYKDILILSGQTSRISQLLSVLDDVSHDRFVNTPITHSTIETPNLEKPLDISSSPVSSSGSLPEVDLSKRGSITITDHILFKKVPIYAPNGAVILKELSFAVFPGMNTLVSGPNGSGKSSMFRILGGLWPVYGGELHRPPSDMIFYLPQRPYMCSGTLRDQIIYPHSKDEMEQVKGISDDDLIDILKVVLLDGLVSREGGWDTVKEWRDYLSAGDMQRIAMARLFYHQPKFAIMDECTSSVSLEIERIIQSLWKYHNHILEFDGKGGYVFTQFKPEERIRLLNEKHKLEEQTKLYEDLERRLGRED